MKNSDHMEEIKIVLVSMLSLTLIFITALALSWLFMFVLENLLSK